MAIALDEKINKIKLQNEEIRRRHEEVEADKKNAAKLNALVKMVPSSDWPERKEPPEFASCNRNTPQARPKSTSKEHYYSAGGQVEGKVMHKFAEGDGPPPDPKYNFLADSERDNNRENNKDDDKKKDRNRFSRGGGGGGAGNKRRGGGRDSFVKQQDYHAPQMQYKKEAPEYEAWRAERNRIDEARINRQKTAEGNWRREWDNNKIVETESRKDIRMKGDENKKDYKDYDKRYYHDADYANYGRTNDSRVPHSPFRNMKGPQDTHRTNVFHPQSYPKSYHDVYSSGNSDRTPNKNMKSMVSQGPNTPKGPVMSVKVNSTSIAGTGRVGPRQKTRVTYSTVSEGDMYESERSKFNDDRYNGHKPMPPKSPYSQRQKDQSYSSKNDSWKNDKGLSQKRDYKDSPRSQRQVSHGNVPKWSGLHGRIERVRSDKSVELLNKSDEKSVDDANKLESEISVLSEAVQPRLSDDEKTFGVQGFRSTQDQYHFLQAKEENLNENIHYENQVFEQHFDDKFETLNFENKSETLNFDDKSETFNIAEKSEYFNVAEESETLNFTEKFEHFNVAEESENSHFAEKPANFNVTEESGTLNCAEESANLNFTEKSDNLNFVDNTKSKIEDDLLAENESVNLIEVSESDDFHSLTNDVDLDKEMFDLELKKEVEFYDADVEIKKEVDENNSCSDKLQILCTEAEQDVKNVERNNFVKQVDNTVIEEIDEPKISDNNFVKNLIQDIIETVSISKESTTKDSENSEQQIVVKQSDSILLLEVNECERQHVGDTENKTEDTSTIDN